MMPDLLPNMKGFVITQLSAARMGVRGKDFATDNIKESPFIGLAGRYWFAGLK